MASKPTYDDLVNRISALEKEIEAKKKVEDQPSKAGKDWKDIFHARQELRKSEEKYRRIFESIQDVYYQTDISGMIRVISPSVKNILGYDSGEMTGQSVLTYYTNPGDRDRLLKKMASSGQVRNYDIEFTKKNGQIIIGSLNSRVIPGEDGQPAGFEGVIRDVTELRKAERETAKAHQELSQIFEATVPMCVVSGDYRIIRANQRFADFFGNEQSTLAGQKCYGICQWSVCQTGECVLKKVFDEETTVEFEVLREATAGKKRYCIVTASPYRDVDGQIVGMVESFTDITRRNQLEEQLRMAQKMESIGTLAGGIAHDFNNILSAIIGFSELAIDDTEEGSQMHDNLSEIMHAGNRARELVQQILAFSRQNEADFRPFQVTLIVKEVVKMLRATLPSSIRIEENLSSEKLIVNADPTQLHQVIVNLATNARQAMSDRPGVLEIALDSIHFDESIENRYPDVAPGDYARIRVTDTGTGIPEAYLNKIFDPYFTTREQKDGAGLGLFVIHGIVKKHHGVITVDSKAGQGTTVYVYLPLIKKRSPELPGQPAVLLPTGKESILVVDDEPAILKMQQQALERLGYKVSARVSSLEALEAFRAFPDNYQSGYYRYDHAEYDRGPAGPPDQGNPAGQAGDIVHRIFRKDR